MSAITITRHAACRSTVVTVSVTTVSSMASYGELFTVSLEDYRRANHLTQADIAKALNVTTVTISRKLSGARKWSLDDVERITEAFPDFAVMFPLFMEEV